MTTADEMREAEELANPFGAFPESLEIGECIHECLR